ncbi:MAG: nitrile hydratase accessory protein [Gammaproteobacteria bacterium]|jgi:nitrile hydratase accessory protein
MNVERLASGDIAEMQLAALPRKSGEMVFHDEWERRAFSMAVSLAEQGVYEWSEFQAQLIIAVSDAEQNDPQNPKRGYYESWLVALETLLENKKLLGD